MTTKPVSPFICMLRYSSIDGSSVHFSAALWVGNLFESFVGRKGKFEGHCLAKILITLYDPRKTTLELIGKQYE